MKINITNFSDIKQRLITGAIFFAIIFGVSFLGDYFGYKFIGFALIFTFLMMICSYEWARLSGLDEPRAKIYAGGFFVMIATSVLVLLGYKTRFMYDLLTMLMPVLIIFHLWGNSKIVSLLAGFAYLITATMTFVILLPADSMARGVDWWVSIILIWAMVIATDMGAYIVGRIVGGKKLAPKVSPGKTISGFLGGVLIGGYVFAYFVEAQSVVPTDFVMLFTMGVILAGVSQVGDLYQSYMKRTAGVKDSGTILPGHGGIFDRLDGLIMVLAFIPIAFVFKNYFGG